MDETGPLFALGARFNCDDVADVEARGFEPSADHQRDDEHRCGYDQEAVRGVDGSRMTVVLGGV